MASIRLNKETRRQVAKAIVDEHFKKDDDALYAKRVQLLHDFSKDVTVQEIYEVVKNNKQVELFYKQPTQFKFWASGTGEIVIGYDYHDANKQAVVIPRFYHDHTNLFGSDAFRKKVEDYHWENREHQKKRNELLIKVEAKLSEFGTYKRVIEGWPEIEKYVKAVIPNATSTALSVNVHSLNEELGLPK